jgi:trehalose 6-phosphate synthase
MNLVAKEYVAAQDPENPGVLILSNFAGAAYELDAALQVNPHDTRAVVQAIDQALMMSLPERRERHVSLMAALKRHSIQIWADRFITQLKAVRR